MLRTLILDASASMATFALVAAVLSLRDLIKGNPDRLLLACLAGAGLGSAPLIALIAEAVAKAPFIPSSWRAWTYLAGLVVAGPSFLGLAVYVWRQRVPAKEGERMTIAKKARAHVGGSPGEYGAATAALVALGLTSALHMDGDHALKTATVIVAAVPALVKVWRVWRAKA